jgi:membrane protease YdiL (CAAX protease family)/DNA-directed RNA polymerase subunit RPC12/RpoP
MNGEPSGERELPQQQEIALGTCWRCGKEVDLGRAQCPYCTAGLLREARPALAKPTARDPDAAALTRMLVVFGGLLAVSLICGFAAQGIVSSDLGSDDSIEREAAGLLAVFEGIDTVFVLAALAWVPVRFRHPRRSLGQRAGAWTGFVLVMAGLVALNLRYHQSLRDLIDFVSLEEQISTAGDRLAVWFLIICVQPAIVEELFFRYLVLGVLRSVVNLHAAVWISAVMFGLAHLGAPLSIPMLVLVGVALGYARTASGGILLPMFLHFLHNGAVLSIHMGWVGMS